MGRLDSLYSGSVPDFRNEPRTSPRTHQQAPRTTGVCCVDEQPTDGALEWMYSARQHVCTSASLASMLRWTCVEALVRVCDVVHGTIYCAPATISEQPHIWIQGPQHTLSVMVASNRLTPICFCTSSPISWPSSARRFICVASS